MAPQARLTFTPSASLAPPQPAPGLALSPVHHDRRLPSRSPTVDCIGAFSLRRCGGVKVGPVEVAVQRGTTIVQEAGNSRDGESLGELSWHGLDQAGTAGTWRLHLINATEADIEAIHRALLLLPPARAHAHTPARIPASNDPAPRYPYRNSLIIYDSTRRSIVSVLPLGPAQSHSSAHPALHSPSPSYHPSAPDFAAYIDHVAASLSPNPTPEALAAEVNEERRRRDELAREEEADDEWREDVVDPVLDFTVLPAPTSREYAAGVPKGRRPPTGEFKRLDLEMDLALGSSRVQPACFEVPSNTGRTRPTSMLSVSSFATFGSERFVTADEGETSDEDGTTSVRSGPPQKNAASRINTNSVVKGTPVLTRLRDPSFEPPQDLTNGNAILLSFLGASISPTSSSRATDTSPSGFSIRAERLSAAEVEVMRQSGQIEVAQVEVTQEQLASVEQEQHGVPGWWSWLLGAMGTRQGLEAEQEQVADSSSGASSWLSWLASAFLPQLSAASTNGPAIRRGRTARTAAGEATARLSVFFVDEAGRGGPALVARGGLRGR